MQGISRTLSRLSAARVMIAGAAILAGWSSTGGLGTAEAQTNPTYDDTAFARPRIDPRGASGVALPQPLPPSEAARIRRIFDYQAHGDIAAALRETAELDLTYQPGIDMLGHILADRYLGPSTRPGADDLRSWLQRWPGLPDAPAIHALLLTRLPKGATAPPAPAAVALAHDQGAPLGPVPEDSEPDIFTLSRNPALDRSVHDAARAGGAAAVERLLGRTQGLTPLYASQLRGEAAQILFTLNRDADAFVLGAAGRGVCGDTGCVASALAGQMAGLAAWRMGRIEQARPMFEAAAKAELSTASLRSAAAFWTARAELRNGRPALYHHWMTRAAAEPRTFYGLLARRALGLGFGFSPTGRDVRETLSEADIEAVAARPEGMRAFSLLQVGQRTRAEAELRQLWPAATSEPALGRAIMLVANHAGLVQLAAQLADLVQAADGVPRDATRFPIPRLWPSSGFQVDPAMVYAITRTESNFNTRLVSSAGATGLMQIMPETASFLTGRRAGGALVGELREPGTNLDLGQRYVAYLATHDVVGGDLLRLLASYNAGPGNFGRWGPTIRHGGDPLLFIEAIPIDETRTFVPRVLTYTWIYAARMNLPTPSLDELAAGAWPRYHPLDPQQAPVLLH
jgi:soluble lytic murein transglycosylase-like protein